MAETLEQNTLSLLIVFVAFLHIRQNSHDHLYQSGV